MFDMLARTIATQAGIRRPVDILLHEDIAAPLTCGFARPAIVLPSDAEEWSVCDETALSRLTFT